MKYKERTLSCLPRAVTVALRRYYKNRARQGGTAWDKTADLHAIDDACTVSNVGFKGVAGTFWFTRKTVCIEVSEQTLAVGGERISSRDKRSYP